MAGSHIARSYIAFMGYFLKNHSHHLKNRRRLLSKAALALLMPEGRDKDRRVLWSGVQYPV